MFNGLFTNFGLIAVIHTQDLTSTGMFGLQEYLSSCNLTTTNLLLFFL